jgi:threonine/homoserine/homoserine lactone efflux protein
VAAPLIPEPTALAAFIAATVVLLVIPGPAVLYIVARSLDQGRLAGLISTLGIGVGTLVHVAAATLGVSALLVSSAAAFDVVRYLGAAYLVYLGCRRLVGGTADPLPVRPPRTRTRIFLEGVGVNVLNPKTALFVFAFLPQFVDVSRGSAAAQVAFLGLLFVALGVVSDSVWAIAAGSAGSWLRSRTSLWSAQRFLAGGMLIALGVAAALSGRGRE